MFNYEIINYRIQIVEIFTPGEYEIEKILKKAKAEQLKKEAIERKEEVEKTTLANIEKFKKGEQTVFVLVKVTNNIQNPDVYDVLWMETFKEHAKKQNAKVWFAGVGIANAESVENPVFKDQPYYVAFEDFIIIL